MCDLGMEHQPSPGEVWVWSHKLECGSHLDGSSCVGSRAAGNDQALPSLRWYKQRPVEDHK